ncbi:MAG: DUF6541 family protein [Acidimicrobiia bacterium]
MTPAGTADDVPEAAPGMLRRVVILSPWVGLVIGTALLFWVFSRAGSNNGGQASFPVFLLGVLAWSLLAGSWWRLATRSPNPAGALVDATVTAVDTAGAVPEASPKTFRRVLSLSPWVGLVIGVPLLVWSFSLADTSTGGQAYFLVFWLGFFAFALPASLAACARTSSTQTRLTLLALLGMWSYIPKILRDPSMPLFSDEIAHWRQADELVQHGRLFQPNPLIPIIQYFPGLHAMTATIVEITGLSTWRVGQLLVLVTHGCALLAVYVLARALTGSDRTAAFVGIVYAMNPSFMFFDSQYSYESIAIVFFLWALAATAMALKQESQSQRARLVAWCSIAMLLAISCVTIHHLTSYILAIVLVIVAVCVTVTGRADPGYRKRRRTAWIIALVTLSAAVLWLVTVARGSVVAYFSPYISGGISQVLGLLKHEHSGRALFQGSLAPWYEKLAAWLAPVIAFIVTCVGVVRYRKGRWRSLRPMTLGLCGFGLLYFVAIPFFLSSSGNEGARRSWGFSTLGLAMIAAVTAASLWRAAKTRPRLVRAAVMLCAVGALLITWVGNTTTSLNVAYRFPGPYIFGSDSRSLNDELLGLTSWFKENFGTGRQVITDRYSGIAIAGYGRDTTAAGSNGFKIWELFFDKTRPPALLLNQMETSGYDFVIVDRRIAVDKPFIGVYFEPDEPIVLQPSGQEAIDKFWYFPWAIQIYNSDNLAIYRIDYAALNAATSRTTTP